MKKWLLLLTLFSTHSLMSQISEVESEWVRNGLNHSSVKSFSFENIERLFDSSKVVKWDVFPDIIGSYGNRQFKTQLGAGAMVEVGFKKKIAFQMRYTAGFSNAPNISYSPDLQTKAYFMNAVDKKTPAENYIYNDLRFRFTYRPINQIELQAGIDNQHYGEGDRSLMMGQQSAPSPFVKIKGSIWRLQYEFLQQVWSEGMFTKNYLPKGAATHYISYKVTKSIHVGIFESVVYGMKDTLYNRGISLEYMNPFIFYRPQEYNLGSTDNVILGLNASYQNGGTMLYGSIVLDEFLLGEIKARKRWWANKYAAQIGVKSHFKVGEHRFFHRFEANLVRPFTYTQIRPDVVYANERLPKAHPLGANFIELYDEFNWKFKHYDFTVFLQYYLKGDMAISTDNPGGDIYLPYTQRKEEYNYTIGRGTTRWHYTVGAHLAYGIMKDKWKVFIEPRLMIDKVEKSVFFDGYMTVGIHRQIGAYRRNY